MFDKLTEVEAKYESISLQLQDPDVESNQEQYKQMQ